MVSRHKILFCFQGKKCKSKWSCCGRKCYYFSDELKNFEESKKICKEMDSTLLKIEDKEELVMYFCFPSHPVFIWPSSHLLLPKSIFFFFKLCWVFLATLGLSLAVVTGLLIEVTSLVGNMGSKARDQQL